MGEITLQGYVCERCKHKWVPRDAKKRPLVCPKCKRIDWGERKGMIEFIN